MGRREAGRGGRGTQEEMREEVHLPALLQRAAVVNKTPPAGVSSLTFIYVYCFVLSGPSVGNKS